MKDYLELQNLQALFEKPSFVIASLGVGVLFLLSSSYHLYQAKPSFSLESDDIALSTPVTPEIQERPHIENSHLFGVYEPKKDLDSAKPTDLQIELLGILESDKKAASAAIIAPKGQSGENYYPGDKIPGGAKLVQVLPNKVIIERNEALETLELPVFKESIFS